MNQITFQSQTGSSPWHVRCHTYRSLLCSHCPRFLLWLCSTVFTLSCSNQQKPPPGILQSQNILAQSTSLSAAPVASWGQSGQVTLLLKTYYDPCPQMMVILTSKRFKALCPTLHSGLSLPSSPACRPPPSSPFRLCPPHSRPLCGMPFPTSEPH